MKSFTARVDRTGFALRRFGSLFILLLAVGVGPLSGADKPASLEELILIEPGTLPIVISAPHGGRIDIPNVPKRENKDATRFVTARDENTFELANELRAGIERRLKGKPYIVAARFSRRTTDANRGVEDAYESPYAKPVYEKYHEALAAACKKVLNERHAGLLIDVHGQVSYPDEVLVGTVTGKSVKLLIERHGRSALVGEDGVLGWLKKAGVPTIPAIDAEDLTAPKYNGGYIVQTYGSHRPGGLDAIQLEFGSKFRQQDDVRQDTAERIADVIARYYKEFLSPSRQAAPVGAK